MPTPGSDAPWSTMHPRRVSRVNETPTTCRQLATPYQVGPACTTFRTPHPFSPMSPQASVQLLALLELVTVEGEEPPSPRNLSFSVPLHGFDGVMQHGGVALLHPLSVECFVFADFNQT